MSNFEDKLRELAEKGLNGSESVQSLTRRMIGCPTTAMLVADVIAAAREVTDCVCNPHNDSESDDVLAERATILRLEQVLAALDAHHASIPER